MLRLHFQIHLKNEPTIVKVKDCASFHPALMSMTLGRLLRKLTGDAMKVDKT